MKQDAIKLHNVLGDPHCTVAACLHLSFDPHSWMKLLLIGLDVRRKSKQRETRTSPDAE